MSVTTILRVEGAVLLVAAVAGYWLLGASWWVFAVLLLVPDVFMLGYAKSSRLGAHLYNLGHTYVVPFAVALGAGFTASHTGLIVAVIWFAHISMDRMLGYGLKLPTGFRDTHLGRIGHDR